MLGFEKPAGLADRVAEQMVAGEAFARGREVPDTWVSILNSHPGIKPHKSCGGLSHLLP